MSNNRHHQRWTPADTDGRSLPSQACRNAGSPHRDLASGRRGHHEEATSTAELGRRSTRRRPLRGARGRAPAPGLSLGEAPQNARRPPRLRPPQISQAHPARRPVLHAGVFLGGRVSSSRGRGKSARYARAVGMRSDTPTLDLLPTCKGWAPARKRAGAGTCS